MAASFGALHYAFTYKNALFVILNTEDPPLEAPEDILNINSYLVAEMVRDTVGTEERLAEMFDGRSNDPILKPLSDVIDSVNVNNESMTGEQLTFLSDVLSRYADVEWTFVFFHKPMWQTRSVNWLHIEAMLKHRPHTAFCGHTHYYAHKTEGLGAYFNMAMTGGVVHKRGAGSMDHSLLVNCRGGAPSYINIHLKGLLDVDGEHGQQLLR